MKRHALPMLLLAATLAYGCSSPATVGGQEEFIVFEVAPEQEPCQGEMQDLCIQVRRPGEDEWRNFFDPIAGFDYEPGFHFTIEVARREIENPLADGSSFSYRLVRILEKTAAGG